MRYAIALTVWTLLSAGAIFADESERNRDDGERRGPPRAAVEACASAVQGDPCSFEGRRGESVEGTCEAPAEKPLACRPANAPPMELVQHQ